MIRITVGPSDTNTPTRNHVPSSNSDSITIAMDNHHEHHHIDHHHNIIMKIYISKGSLYIDPQAINWIIHQATSTTNTTSTGINSSHNNIYNNSDNNSSRSSSSSSSNSHSQSKKEKAEGVRGGSIHSLFHAKSFLDAVSSQMHHHHHSYQHSSIGSIGPLSSMDYKNKNHASSLRVHDGDGASRRVFDPFSIRDT
jgi:hypothetical protein